MGLSPAHIVDDQGIGSPLSAAVDHILAIANAPHDGVIAATGVDDVIAFATLKCVCEICTADQIHVGATMPVNGTVHAANQINVSNDGISGDRDAAGTAGKVVARPKGDRAGVGVVKSGHDPVGVVGERITSDCRFGAAAEIGGDQDTGRERAIAGGDADILRDRVVNDRNIRTRTDIQRIIEMVADTLAGIGVALEFARDIRPEVEHADAADVGKLGIDDIDILSSAAVKHRNRSPGIIRATGTILDVVELDSIEGSRTEVTEALIDAVTVAIHSYIAQVERHACRNKNHAAGIARSTCIGDCLNSGRLHALADDRQILVNHQLAWSCCAR